MFFCSHFSPIKNSQPCRSRSMQERKISNEFGIIERRSISDAGIGCIINPSEFLACIVGIQIHQASNNRGAMWTKTQDQFLMCGIKMKNIVLASRNRCRKQINAQASRNRQQNSKSTHRDEIDRSQFWDFPHTTFWESFREYTTKVESSGRRPDVGSQGQWDHLVNYSCQREWRQQFISGWIVIKFCSPPRSPTSRSARHCSILRRNWSWNNTWNQKGSQRSNGILFFEESPFRYMTGIQIVSSQSSRFFSFCVLSWKVAPTPYRHGEVERATCVFLEFNAW